MLAYILASIGLVVGVALDALTVKLAAGVEPTMGSASGSLGNARGVAIADRTPIVTRRLVIVAVTSAAFALIGTYYSDPVHVAVVSAYACVLVTCSATDLLAFRVPNVVTYPAILGALVVGATMPGADLVEVVAGGLVAGGVLLLPALLTGGLGMGDVKLATFVGLAVGFWFVPAALLLMALVGGIVAAALLLSGLRKWSEPIPYAPFISAGALATMLWQGTAFSSLT